MTFKVALLAIALAAAPNFTPPPGAVNPQVTQANISTTICVRGWTATIRPPLTYTSNLKRRQMAERHLPGKPSDYEEDHFIPLDLGGHPTSPANLWPQAMAQAQRKDRLEHALNRAVCAGRMTLLTAQQKDQGSGGVEVGSRKACAATPSTQPSGFRYFLATAPRIPHSSAFKVIRTRRREAATPLRFVFVGETLEDVAVTDLIGRTVHSSVGN